MQKNFAVTSKSLFKKQVYVCVLDFATTKIAFHKWHHGKEIKREFHIDQNIICNTLANNICAVQLSIPLPSLSSSSKKEFYKKEIEFATSSDKELFIDLLQALIHTGNLAYTAFMAITDKPKPPASPSLRPPSENHVNSNALGQGSPRGGGSGGMVEIQTLSAATAITEAVKIATMAAKNDAINEARAHTKSRHHKHMRHSQSEGDLDNNHTYHNNNNDNNNNNNNNNHNVNDLISNMDFCVFLRSFAKSYNKYLTIHMANFNSLHNNNNNNNKNNNINSSSPSAVETEKKTSSRTTSSLIMVGGSGGSPLVSSQSRTLPLRSNSAPNSPGHSRNPSFNEQKNFRTILQTFNEDEEPFSPKSAK